MTAADERESRPSGESLRVSSDSPRSPQYFPKTSTCYGRLAREGQAEELDPRLMVTYYEPLKKYLLGSRSFRGDLERARQRGTAPEDFAHEVISGFFVEKLQRGRYLEKWVTTDMGLGQYLRGGIWLHIHAVRKQLARSSRIQDLDWDVAEVELGAGEELDRELVRSITRQAIASAREAIARKGQEKHWELWMAHVFGDERKGYSEIGKKLGISPRSAQVLWKTARNALERAWKEQVSATVADPSQARRRIAAYLAAVGCGEPR